MTTWYAQSSSKNIDTANLWNDASNGSGSWLTWSSLASGDTLAANGKTALAINVDFTCAEINTSSGGGYTVSTARTITANVVAGTASCIVDSASAGTTVTVIGNVSSAQAGAYGIDKTGGGTLAVTGNVGNGAGTAGIRSSSGTVNINGNVTGGTSSNCYGVRYYTAGTVNITGNITGGATSNSYGVYIESALTLNVYGNNTVSGSANSPGVYSNQNVTINVTGNVTGGSGNLTMGMSCTGTGSSITVTGNVTGGSYGNAYGIANSGSLTVTGTVTGGSSDGAAGIYSTGSGTVTINGKIVDTASAAGVCARKLHFNPASTDYHQAYNGSGTTTLYPLSGSLPDAKYLYNGIDRGDGTTGTLNASNISAAVGSGSNLSAGILKKDEVVDDVTGTYEGEAGGRPEIRGANL